MGRAACSIDGCGRALVARTYCPSHWRKWRLYGDPLHIQPRQRVPAFDRFWSKVNQGGECWEWTAARDALGYGFFRMEPARPMWRAHRAAWELTNGAIPDGMIVCHRCDNPPCVRPDHLFLGSEQDNVDDRVAKDRSSRQISHFGETSPLAKLSAEQVDAIRYRYTAGGILQRELAEEYGVTQTTISKIVRGVRWKQAS